MELSHLDSEGIIARPLAEVSERLLRGGEVKQIYEMKGAGYSAREIARELGLARNTVLRYLKSPEATMRFETAPGEQAQVDWGSLSYLSEGGKRRSVWVFVMTMGWSRACYVELVRKADTAAFIQCHVNAFEYLGGVPREWRPFQDWSHDRYGDKCDETRSANPVKISCRNSESGCPGKSPKERIYVMHVVRIERGAGSVFSVTQIGVASRAGCHANSAVTMRPARVSGRSSAPVLQAFPGKRLGQRLTGREIRTPPQLANWAGLGADRKRAEPRRGPEAGSKGLQVL